jgi:uncharacterized membrane-anchored protein YjiN (DUF445 family)
MRVAATGLLLLMLAVFIACWMFEAKFPWLAYPRAFAEAGMVGGCADWFAVVALFRHPLGLPIPHTAILPRNKQRIAVMLGTFFSRNFFNPTEIAARLDKIDVCAWFSSWMSEPENARLVLDWSRRLVPPALELFGRSQVRVVGRNLIRNGIDSIAAAPLAGRVLAVVVAQGQHGPVFDLGLDVATDFLAENRKAFRQKAAEKASGWLPGWVDSKLADVFLDELLDILTAARAPDHPWRDQFRAALDGWIVLLANDPEIYERGERIKSEVLDTKLIDDYLAWFATEAETTLKAELEAENGALAATLERGLLALGEWIGRDEGARDAINRSIRQLVMNTIVPHHDEIGGFVSDVVARWDNDTLVGRLELQVGQDLQFIRINGTVVGGIVGLLVLIVTRLLG